MTQPTDPLGPETLKALQDLTREVQVLNRHRFITVQNSVFRQMLFQFGRGLAFGLGSVLGATLLVSLITWWLSQFEFLPIIGDWMVMLSDEFQRATGGQPDINQIKQ